MNIHKNARLTPLRLEENGAFSHWEPFVENPGGAHLTAQRTATGITVRRSLPITCGATCWWLFVTLAAT